MADIVEGGVWANQHRTPDRPRCGGTPGKPGTFATTRNAPNSVLPATEQCKGCADCDQPAKEDEMNETCNQCGITRAEAEAEPGCSIEDDDMGARYEWGAHKFSPTHQPAPTPSGDNARLDEIKARAAAATEGPWGWRGQAKGSGPLHLISLKPPMYYVMGFTRHGMRGGQPVFRLPDAPWAAKASEISISSVTYADRVCDIPAPDARFIAHSRADVDYLLSLVAESAAALEEARATSDHWHEMDRLAVQRAEAAEQRLEEARAYSSGLEIAADALRADDNAARTMLRAERARAESAEQRLREARGTIDTLQRSWEYEHDLAVGAEAERDRLLGLARTLKERRVATFGLENRLRHINAFMDAVRAIEAASRPVPAATDEEAGR